MVFQASTRWWRSVAVGLALLPILAGLVRPTQAQVLGPPGSTAGSAGSADAARQLLRQARQALTDNDPAKAEQLALRVKQMNVPGGNFWDDSPDAVLAEVQRRRGGKPADPRALLKQAREALHAGRTDEAKLLATRANAVSTNWGLFEDTPAKVLRDAQKVMAQQDRQESVRLLSEARILYKQGNLEEARAKARRADIKHGPYSMWDLGDRPDKLLVEIDAAEARARKIKVPPPVGPPSTAPRPPDSALVQQTGPSGVQRTDFQPPPAGPAALPTLPAAPAMPVPPAPPAPPTGPVAPPAPPADPNKPRALAMLRDGRVKLAGGDLLAARQQAMDAQKFGTAYGPDDDRPDLLLADVQRTAAHQIAVLVRDAQAAPAADKAGVSLARARQVATTFGLDTHAIDDTAAAWQRRQQPVAVAVAPAAPAVPLPAVPGLNGSPTAGPSTNKAPNPGEEMLVKSWLELRNGNTAAAHRLAEEVFNGPYGLQDQAAAMLRSISVEENNQRVLTAERSFDAGRAAFLKKDYAQASAVFQQIDPALLPPQKRASYKEMVVSLPSRRAPAPPAPAAPGTGEVQTVGLKATPIAMPTPGTAVPVSNPADFAKQVQALQEVEFQRLRSDGLTVQSEATGLFQKGETDAAIGKLQDYLAKVKESRIDPAKVALLQRPVDHRLQQFKMMKAQRDFEHKEDVKRADFKEHRNRDRLNEEHKHEQVVALMRDYRSLMNEGKYSEAELAAEKAQELDPDNPATGAAVFTARTQGNVVKYHKIKEAKEKMFVDGLNDAETPGPAVTSHDPMNLDPEALKRAKKRASFAGGLGGQPHTERERTIERHLSTPLAHSIDFKNVPLRQAVDDLRTITQLDIVPDLKAIADKGINFDQPVTLKLEPGVPLKSVLTLLLRQAGLVYHLNENVLQVTTEEQARGRLRQKTFAVADLVIPIDNYAIPSTSQFDKILGRQVESRGAGAFSGGPNPGSRGLPGGQPVSGSATMTAGGPGGLPGGGATLQSSPMSASTTTTMAKNTMEDTLIKLITNTIAPQSWSDVGGPGTIDYFPIGMALVINQTPDVIEQVADLLEQLRRLQDLEVAVEVRLISLAEEFFERIGLDLSLNIVNKDKYKAGVGSVLTGQVPAQPDTVPQTFQPGRALLGLTPAGTFTHDLNIPITQNSFQYAIPPFGGFPQMPGMDGGLSLGLAFLSDIQVYMFMEAAQGDRRTNVMQAPKLTLFNGQTATIMVMDQQFFVTNVSVVSVNGQIVFSPMNDPFPLGVQLTIQAVVSADRRYVRLNLNPILTNLASAVVPLFPVTTFITPTFDGGFQGQPIPFTQFVQQPAMQMVNIQTTVSVPDGGTVLLGGLKTLSEGRNEFGPPVLSKIPYLNRLVKNVGFGRETQSLMMMVTPRIIINSEEEERATGIGGFGGSQ